MSPKSQETQDALRPPISEVRKLNRGVGRPASTDPKGDELRELILAAASQDYAENGFHGSSVAHILAISGVSRPTFYRYFQNRREALDIIIGRANDMLGEIVARKIEGVEDLEGVVHAAIDAYVACASRCGPIAFHRRTPPRSRSRRSGRRGG